MEQRPWIMLPDRLKWVQNWPEPGRGTKEEVVAWLDAAPSGAMLESHSREWAHKQGGKWLVDEYRSGMSPTRIGELTSSELYDLFNRGMGWGSVRPRVTTQQLHALLTVYTK